MGNVQNPSGLTSVTISDELGAIGAAIQTYLRANIAANDNIHDISYVRNAANPNRVTAYILWENMP